MPEKSQPPPTPDEEDISLNDALSDLEHMLDGRVGEEDAVSAGGVDTNQQYSIPLLDDVVVAGTVLADETGEAIAVGARPLASVEDDDSQAVIKRLTNEIEVIVQAGVEEAVQKASKEITARVRKHVNIILPEILDELVELKSRKNQV